MKCKKIICAALVAAVVLSFFHFEMIHDQAGIAFHRILIGLLRLRFGRIDPFQIFLGLAKKRAVKCGFEQ